MPTPRFVRFARALALVGGPCVGLAVVFIPAFVEGCSSSSASGINGVLLEDSNLPEGTVLEDMRPVGLDTTPEVVGEDGSDADGDALDSTDSGDGGPGEPPDLPFFARMRT